MSPPGCLHNVKHYAQQLVLPRQCLILGLGVLQGSGMPLSLRGI